VSQSPVTDGAAQSPAAGQGRPPALAVVPTEELLDLEHRRKELTKRVQELQWDLGGLVYEMAVRDRIRVDVIVRKAAELQHADAELGEVERILKADNMATAGACAHCGAPHSSGAVYCWQCGQPIVRHVDTGSILTPS
jgi:chorismate mutase